MAVRKRLKAGVPSGGSPRRQDLLDSMTVGITQLNARRRADEMHRNGVERGDQDIVFCLGRGRCGFPENGDHDGKRFCPFCLYYKETRSNASDWNAVQAIQKFVKGN
jgi:hypothetical protein